jgi:hypothetical protein
MKFLLSFDARLMNFCDRLVMFFHNLEVPRIMLLRIFFVLWLVPQVMRSILLHLFDITQIIMWSILIFLFVTNEIYDRNHDAAHLNLRVVTRRGSSGWACWHLFLCASFLFFIWYDSQIQMKALELLADIGWFSYLIIGDTIYPTEPPKRKKRVPALKLAKAST